MNAFAVMPCTLSPFRVVSTVTPVANIPSVRRKAIAGSPSSPTPSSSSSSAGGGAVYGGTKNKIIGFCVLAGSLLLFLFRRIVQDKEPPHWREETPTHPDTHEAALLQKEMSPV